jgi:hypothetical protein
VRGCFPHKGAKPPTPPSVAVIFRFGIRLKAEHIKLIC